DTVTLRTATSNEVSAINALITSNLAVGHLLPRTMADLTEHAARFTVAASGDRIIGCVELAPLSPGVAEARSLVVDEAMRGQHIGSTPIEHMTPKAGEGGVCSL